MGLAITTYNRPPLAARVAKSASDNCQHDTNPAKPSRTTGSTGSGAQPGAVKLLVDGWKLIGCIDKFCDRRFRIMQTPDPRTEGLLPHHLRNPAVPRLDPVSLLYAAQLGALWGTVLPLHCQSSQCRPPKRGKGYSLHSRPNQRNSCEHGSTGILGMRSPIRRLPFSEGGISPILCNKKPSQQTERKCVY